MASIRPKKYPGFTLMELSVVIIVLSIMIGGILAAVTQEIRREKMAAYKNKIATIEKALQDYRVANDNLPCPADLHDSIQSATFGVPAGTPGNCNTAILYFDGAKTVGGAIPVRTLGLADEYAFDPWGGKFTYIADITVTIGSAFSTALTVTNTVSGTITVKDTAGNVKADHVLLAIISHGPNGHGAFQLSGARKSAESQNANEQKNCHCNADATNAAFDTTVVMGANSIDSGNADVTHIFDDIVTFYKRNDFLSASERVIESH